ncbi:carboxymuconolactone decarboxylase family protein [Flavisphingomonas formosensis]|uniref:carboxymuconolactone decarboxylase family protein n=1 Tax=Flavisphingomonas formosensis TaxID=861534 RepID=UPI0012F78A5E|nr:carboxymuconolactone decarboxylase family protein [Sphingomonas formosensis]
MVRVPLVDIESLEGPVGDALRSRPGKLNIVGMMAHAQGCVVEQLQLGRSVNSQQDLDALSRELLVLLAAHLDGGEYVWRQHVPIAERHGATKAKIDALGKGDIASKAFSADERALLAYGAQVIRGGQVDDITFRAAARRYSHRELVEAILAIGYYMTMNRLTAATCTPLEVSQVAPSAASTVGAPTQ